MKLIFYPFLFFQLIACSYCMAQAPVFKPLRLEKGFPGNSVKAFIEDKDGTILIAAADGIYEFDGIDYLPLSGDGESPAVTALCKGLNGRVWLGYANGSMAFLENKKLTSFEPEEGLPAKPISGLGVDKEGRLWISTQGEGLYYYQDQRLYNINEDDGLSDAFVYSLLLDDFGNAWVGTDNGINICRVESGKKKIKRISIKDGLPDNIVQVLAKSNDGNILAGMHENGFCIIDKKNFAITYDSLVSWDFGPITSIFQYSDSITWIGTEKNGIIEYSKNGHIENYNPYNYFENNRIEAIMDDAEGNTWLAVKGRGLFLAHKNIRKFNAVNGQGLANVSAILADKKGRIWFSQKEKLFCLDDNLKIFESPLSKNIAKSHIISLYEGRDGSIWSGTFGEGVLRLNPETGKFTVFTEPDGLLNGSVFSIAGNGDNIYMATLGGISIAAPEGAKVKFKALGKEAGLGINYIYQVLDDSRGRKWLATDGKGLAVLDGDSIGLFKDEVLKGSTIYSVTEDNSGNIWFISKENGIYKYNGAELINYKLGLDLATTLPSAIATTRAGDAIVVHNKGFSLLAKSGEIVKYSSSHGFGNLDLDLNAITKDSKGNIWIGSRDGILKFEGISENHRKSPKTILKNVMLYLVKVDHLEKNKFSHDENHLSFEFAGLWYQDPENVAYEYLLQGYDLNWKRSKEKIAAYNNLPPGNYVFKVRASANGSFENLETAQFAFTISQPFYFTVWFILSALSVLVGSVFWIMRTRDQRIRKLANLEHEKISFQFETLKNQVNPHFLFNSFNTLINVIEEDQKAAAEYVSNLSDFFRDILSYKDKELITVEEELKILKRYFFLQEKRYHENLNLVISIRGDDLLNYVPPMTFQLLVENAIKHNVVSKQKPLWIKVYKEGQYFVVTNNLQRKKAPLESTGIGLKNIMNRYKIFTNIEVIFVETELEFKVLLPVLNFEK